MSLNFQQLPADIGNHNHCGVIAIIEDDPDLANALGIWFYLHELKAISHPSAESLLQAIRPNRGQLSIFLDDHHRVAHPLLGAVVDLNLPGITGIELARSLRQLKPDFPLVIVTALREEDRLHYGNLPEGVCCLKKPFDMQALEDALFPQLHCPVTYLQ